MLRWLRERFKRFAATLSKGRGNRSPQVVFRKVVVTETPPSVTTVMANTFYVVAPQSMVKWTMFSCPCGCGEVITLSLQRIHNPTWNLEMTKSGRASLHPSVWRTTGCRSHFWIKDGQVFWA
ncbi:hypothetical protein THICB3560240 [Thiomonas sp. CB3]|nr:hypothetical protein THICB3560240 [Thiomonas sp. CB3]